MADGELQPDEREEQPWQGPMAPPIGQPMRTLPMGTPPIVPSQASPMPMPTLPAQQKPAISKLWDKAGAIQNPFARLLARVGTGALGGVEALGEGIAPGIAMRVPGSMVNTGVANRQADQRAEKQAAMQTATQNANTQQQAVEQRPEMAAQAGELKGRLEAEKEAATAARQQQSLESQETRATQREQAAAQAQTERETASDKRQQAQFAAGDQRQAAQFSEQEKLERMREADKDKRAVGEKVTADEQRRADLAENLNENLDVLEDIVKRRPELFGPLAGRWAELKQKFGSDDPDLAKLQTIEHQIGMAQISAHGMRSAQGIQSAADSIMNNLHNGPGSMHAAIQAVRDSVKTFTADVENKRGGAAGDKTKKAADKTTAKDFGPAPSGKAEGSTGTLPDGTKVVVRGGRVVAQ